MTVSNTTAKNIYDANGNQTDFSFTFPIIDESNLVVQVKDGAGNLDTKQLNSDYTVSGTGNRVGFTDYQSGQISFSTAPSSTDTVIITRNVPLTQQVDFTPQGKLPAQSLERSLDKQIFIAQQLKEALQRTVKMDPAVNNFDTTIPDPADEQGTYVTISDQGDGFVLREGPTIPLRGMIKIGEVKVSSPTSALTLDSKFENEFNNYKLIITDLGLDGENDQIYLNFGTGSPGIDTSNNYEYVVQTSSSDKLTHGTEAINDSKIILTTEEMQSIPIFNAEYTFNNVTNPDNFTLVHGKHSYVNKSGHIAGALSSTEELSGILNKKAAVTSLQLTTSGSDHFNAGTLELYGIK